MSHRQSAPPQVNHSCPEHVTAACNEVSESAYLADLDAVLPSYRMAPAFSWHSHAIPVVQGGYGGQGQRPEISGVHGGSGGAREWGGMGGAAPAVDHEGQAGLE